MARVRKLTREERSTARPHPTEVDCRWQVVRASSGPALFQLSTYGSDARVSEPKVSQTIQIDEAVARELVDNLRTTFGF